MRDSYAASDLCGAWAEDGDVPVYLTSVYVSAACSGECGESYVAADVPYVLWAGGGESVDGLTGPGGPECAG